MARRGTGKWVARAAATGGGRTYRGQAPVRWYGSLVLIFLLGVGLVVYSKYERYHPTTSGEPTTSTHWYAALAFDVCGELQSDLPTTPASSFVSGITTQGDGIIHISPATSADAGNNATLGLFVRSYKGLVLTTNELKLPGKPAYRNGGTCPEGTKQAGKKAFVMVQMWTSFSGAGADHPVTVQNPSNLKLTNGQLITVAYVTPGSSIPKPSGTTIVSLLDDVSGQSSTTTTAPSVSTTVVSPTTSTTS